MPYNRMSALLFVLVFIVCAMMAGGHFYSGDTWETFLSTESIVEYHTLQIVKPSFEGESPPSWLYFRTPDGRIYSRYGLGQTLLFIPFYLAGKLMYPNAELTHFSDFARYFYLTDFLFNPTITALTSVIVFYFGRKIGFSQRLSVGLALLFSFATQAWPYAKTLFNGPLVGLCVVLAAYYLWSPRRRLDLVLAGFVGGFAAFVRYEFMIFIVPIGLYVLWSWRGNLKAKVSAGASFAVPFLGWIGMNGLYDFVRVGSILVTPYRPITGFDTPIQLGMYGLLLSPGVGLFVYSPILVLSLVGLYDLMCRDREGFVLLLAWILPLLLLFSMFRDWHGWLGWGTRYLVPIGPLLIIVLGVAVERRWGTRLFRAVFAVLLGVSVFINLLGVLGHLINAYWMSGGTASLLRPGEFVPAKALYDPRYSPIVKHVQLVFDSTQLPLASRLDVPLFYMFPEPLQFAIWSLFAIAIGLLVFTLHRECQNSLTK